jgi:hypothetical protein
MQRRQFVQLGWGAAAWACAASRGGATAPAVSAAEVALPRHRVPLSFIIDDSTCLVNMAHYAMPQFAAAWPQRTIYQKPWQRWPREIPDHFVREFGEWSAAHGVKGKYSIVPNPACVGWLDRELPGWSRPALQDSLRLVRELMVPHWDIHPEMITHTRVLDLKTGRPVEPASPATMENSFPPQPVSVDFLADYLAYALRILRNCDLPCEGITTPGGFGNRVKSELGLAAFEAVRDVYGTPLPHYFKYVVDGEASTAPTLEHVRDLDSDDPRAIVNVPAGTGDWFGGWDGDSPVEGERYCNEDATAGRMVELIERGEPAVMLCHWPGLFNQGAKTGFAAYQKIVTALQQRFADQTLWMKVSEIARYWAAKELTRLTAQEASVQLDAPFACPGFTLRVKVDRPGPVRWVGEGKSVALTRRDRVADLDVGQWCPAPDDASAVLVCIDLPAGVSQLDFLPVTS